MPRFADNPNLPPSALLAATSHPGWVYSPAPPVAAPSKPKFFLARKHFLLAVMTAAIAALFILFFCVQEFVVCQGDSVPSVLCSPLPSDPASLTLCPLQVFYNSVCLSVLLAELLFLYGIAMESLCLSTCAAIFKLVLATWMTVHSFHDWRFIFVSFPLTAIAVLTGRYALDLCKIRDEKRALAIDVEPL